MLPQLQGFRITSLDELTLSPAQFNDFMNDANNFSHPIGAVYTPRTIKRLNHAKREGLIADFRELSPGVYEIRYNGCLLWETIFEYRIEEFLTKLISQSHARV